MIGKQISHYRILEKLGGGGMGVVYKAQDTKLERFVALKFLPPHLSQDEENKKRFIHEAKAASALNHPNIATIYEIDEADGQTRQEPGMMFIAMEYIKGQSLQDMIKGNLPKVLNLRKVLDYAIQIAEGLAKAHAKGIIHRDIKPANILVTEDGVVKIVDFGMAKLAGQTMLTKTGTTLGTVAYMSPEQAQGAKVDHRTDIWALGAVVYEMITGKQPFAGDYEQAVIYSIMNEEPEPPTALRTGVPMELERIANKTLAKSPEERYQNLNDLLVDLRAARKALGAKQSGLVSDSRLRKLKIPSEARTRSRLFLYGTIIAFLAVIISAWWLVRRVSIAPQKLAAKKIAVLPFVNLTADPQQEYFCDGMTEQLITNLSRIPDLKVIARTSVMRYKNTQKDIRDIGRELDVAYILEGSVRKSGNELRVTAQLIQAEEGIHLWAEDYDKQLRDVFAIQDSVSQSIAGALEVTLSEPASRAIASAYPRNVEAYDSYLKARHYVETTYLNTKKEEDFRHALELGKRAVELDPNFALGYIGLGYIYENHWIVTGDPRDLEQEKVYIEKAYELNPNLPEANAAMGLQFLRKGEYDKAFSYMKSALEFNANNPELFHLFGILSWNFGLYEQAAKYYSKALELNPLGLLSLNNRGWSLLLIGQWDRAIGDFERAVQIAPNYVPGLNGFAFALIIKQQYEKANELLSRAESQPPGWAAQELSAIRALYYAAVGERQKALSGTKWAGVLTVLGMKTAALDSLEKTTREEGRYYYFTNYLPLVHLPVYDSLRDEPRFQEILLKEKKKYENRLQKYAIPLKKK